MEGADRFRDMLERIPTSERGDLLQRLTSRKSQERDGARFEIDAWHWFTSAGLTLAKPSGASRTPDWVYERDGVRVYVEATCIEPEQADKQAGELRRLMHEVDQRLGERPWQIEVHEFDLARDSGLAREYSHHLANVQPPRRVLVVGDDDGYASYELPPPRCEFTYGASRIVYSVRRRAPYDYSTGILGFPAGSMYEVTVHDRLAEAIHKKARKYASLSPLVVCVASAGEEPIADSLIDMMLFGGLNTRISRMSDGSERISEHRKPNGALFRSAPNVHLEAHPTAIVVFARSLDSSHAGPTPRMWINPYAPEADRLALMRTLPHWGHPIFVPDYEAGKMVQYSR